MSRSWLANRIRGSRADNERGMLSMVMIVAIIGTSLGALLIPIIVGQSHSTNHSDSRVKALHGAQAGIDVMLGRLRKVDLPTDPGAVSGLFKTASNLPCASLTGTEPSSPTLTYDVTIAYDNMGAGICPTDIPRYATITSTGSDTSGGTTATRVLTTTYSFSSVSYNIQASTSGGQIRLDPLAVGVSDTPTAQCLDGGSMIVGTALTVTTCADVSVIKTSGGYHQLFFYEPDLSLRLFYSISVANPNGLCVTSPAGVTLQQCSPLGSAPTNQQWRLDSLSRFVTAGGSSCMRSVGTNVQVGSCVSSYSPSASWAPTPSAGVGAAGAGLGQLTSLSQADRCAQAMNPDGSNSPPTAMVVLYPCEQQLPPAQVGWYQHFTFNLATQQWSTTYPGGLSYCLTSPGLIAGPVSVTLCSSTSQDQRWVQNGVAAGDPGDATSPGRLYTVKDSHNNCLTVSSTKPYVSAVTQQSYSTLVTAACTTTSDTTGVARAATAQEWNANPGQQSTAATHTVETPPQPVIAAP